MAKEKYDYNKCDGCGEYYEADEKLQKVFDVLNWCDKCVEDLNEFLTKE